MGNRIKIKYEDILNDANLLRAAKNTLRNGVRFKKEGAQWKIEQEKHIINLKKMLLKQTYKLRMPMPLKQIMSSKKTKFLKVIRCQRCCGSII